MRTIAVALLLILGWFGRGLAAEGRKLFTGRPLLQDEKDSGSSCFWDADEELCKVDKSFIEELKGTVEELINRTESCARHIANGTCEESGCFWSGNECTVIQGFIADEDGYEECFGDLADFIKIPENRQKCKQNNTDEESCNATEDCSWDDDDGQCELDILKSFGYEFVLSQALQLIGRSVSITSRPLLSLTETWIKCKLEDDEEQCLPENGCEWDADEEDCEIGVGAITVIIKDTFPLATSAICLAQKALFRSECPNNLSKQECNEVDSCMWDDERSQCIPTNVVLEAEAEKEVEVQMDDAEALCSEARSEEDCNRVKTSTDELE